MTDENQENEETSQGTGAENAEKVGRKLKQAREQAGIHINDMAGRLRMTASQVEALEAGRIEQFGAAIYVRGYVGNYARQVGLNARELLRRLDVPDDQPKLKAAAGIPPGRRFVENLGRWGSYAAGTIVVVLPVIWWASEGTVQLFGEDERPGSELVAEPVAGNAETTATDDGGDSPDNGNRSADRPVMASMAPVRRGRGEPEPADTEPESGTGAVEEESATDGEPESAPEAQNRRELVLEVSQDAWVELHDADGNRLEYDLLRAGSTHRYEGPAPFSVLIGNAGGVQVRYNDAPFDLQPHMQGNLARFRVGEPESAASEG